MSRRPSFPFPFDAYELPLCFDPGAQLEHQWTLVLCMDKSGAFMEAVVYNGNAQRGAYYRTKITSWELTEFEPIGGEHRIPNGIIRQASLHISNLLGVSAHVHHSTNPEP